MTASRTISWNVSTETVPDAFERYLIGMADLYEISEVAEHDRLHFYNDTTSTLTDIGAVGQGRSVRQTLARSPAILRRSDIDGLNVHINRAAVVGDADGRDIRAAPGAVQFRDLARQSMSRLDRVDVITLMVPRYIAPAALLMKSAHGLVIPPDAPGARLLTAQLTSLVELAELLSEAEVETAIQAAMMIAVRITGLEIEVAEAEIAAIHRTVRRSASRYIESRLEGLDPDIKGAAVAKAAGVSRATLYRAFDGAGGVNRYVQYRRLHHARRALRERIGSNLTIADIGYRYGFASPTHFSRQFRACFSYSPSEVERPKVQELAMPSGPIRHDLLADWLKALELREAG